MIPFRGKAAGQSPCYLSDRFHLERNRTLPAQLGFAGEDKTSCMIGREMSIMFAIIDPKWK